MPIKIAMIGAGSIGFTRRLMRDILAVPELADTTFSLTDISEHNLDMVAQFCRRDIEFNNLPARVESTPDRRRAIADADYIICTIRQGGLEAFQTDIDIPLKYGVDQCVGDTICAGGIMYAQRTIPALLDFCSDIRELAKPEALFLNYSNPMAMNTWACNQYGGVRTIGLCHGVQGAHWQIAAHRSWAKREGPDRPRIDKMHRHEVDVVAAGINHQTWFIQVQWRGMDMMPQLARAVRAASEVSRKTEKVRIDVLERFGYYSHRIERAPERISAVVSQAHRARSSSGSTCRAGSTARPADTCASAPKGGNWFETDFPNWLKEEPPKIRPHDRSEEHGSYIIEALETGRTYRGHFNVINQRAHHESAGRMLHRNPRLRRSHRHQHAGRRRLAAGLRGDLLAPACACRRWAWRPRCTAM